MAKPFRNERHSVFEEYGLCLLMLRTLLIALMIIPTVTGFVTERGNDFIEVIGEGELLVDGERVNISGITILTTHSFEAENLTCPAIPLSSDQAIAYGNATLSLSLNAMNESVSAPALEPGMSLNRCPDCTDHYPSEESPCTIPSCSMEIETEPLQEERIAYRIISDEPYTYWIEDAFGTIVRAPAVSSTATIKQYTPPSGVAERVFVVRAENACASAIAVVGFIEEPEDTCEIARIESEPLHETTITYRVYADEPYTYWIEDAWGSIVRSPSQSTTDATKSYTPPSAPGERVFIIHANTSCGVTANAVGITEPIEETDLCEYLEIITEPISEGTVSYRVHAEEPYTYWIEDAYGTILREPSVSSTNALKSYTPSADEHAFIIYANTSCTSKASAVAHRSPKAEHTLCPLPLITAEPIQTERIRYRITSETPYAYSVENLTHALRTDTSATDTVKQYTPSPNKPEQLYTIRAENECGESNLTIGFVSETDHCPEPDSSIICSDHTMRIAELESELDACANPPEHMTSFYTLARTTAESYTYRSNARSNATFIACAAREAQREGDTLTIRLDDRSLGNATPVLLALENGSIIDARIGTVPDFVGNHTADPGGSEPDRPADPDESEDPSSAPTNPPEPPVAAPQEPAEPLRADPIRRAIRHLVNLIRTNRAVQSAEPWIMPVGIGLAGLMLLIPTTPHRTQPR